MLFVIFCFFKQKTAYEMRISDWSSDVCSSDLHHITAQMGATANYRTGHHPRADFAENALVAIGKTQRHLVVIRRWLTIHHLHVIDPEIQQQIGRASCRASVCQYV